MENAEGIVSVKADLLACRRRENGCSIGFPDRIDTEDMSTPFFAGLHNR